MISPNDPDYVPEEEAPSKHEDGKHLLLVDMSKQISICAFATHSTALAEQATKDALKIPFERAVSSYLHNFKDVFDEKDLDELPPSHPWDHTIELLLGVES
jgi:hypothetical protein